MPTKFDLELYNPDLGGDLYLEKKKFFMDHNTLVNPTTFKPLTPNGSLHAYLCRVYGCPLPGYAPIDPRHFSRKQNAAVQIARTYFSHNYDTIIPDGFQPWAGRLGDWWKTPWTGRGNLGDAYARVVQNLMTNPKLSPAVDRVVEGIMGKLRKTRTRPREEPTGGLIIVEDEESDTEMADEPMQGGARVDRGRPAAGAGHSLRGGVVVVRCGGRGLEALEEILSRRRGSA